MVAVEISCEMQSRCESSVDLGTVHPSAAASAVSTAAPLSRDLGSFYVSYSGLGYYKQSTGTHVNTCIVNHVNLQGNTDTPSSRHK